MFAATESTAQLRRTSTRATEVLAGENGKHRACVFAGLAHVSLQTLAHLTFSLLDSFSFQITLTPLLRCRPRLVCLTIFVQHDCYIPRVSTHQHLSNSSRRKSGAMLRALEKLRVSAQNLTHTALQDSLLVLLLTSPAASYAADPAADTTKAIQETAASTPGGPSAFGLIVLFSPLLLYGIFNVYRERINPQAKLSNFAVIIGALLLAANLFSIVVYRVRFF